MSIVFIGVLFVGLLVLTIIVIVNNIKRSSRRKSATEKIHTGKKLEAITNLQLVLQENPNDLVAMYSLAKLQIQSNLAFEGMQTLNMLLGRNLSGSGVSHVKVLLLAVDGELSLGNRKQAHKYLLMAKGVDATDVEVNARLAAFEYEAGNFQEAFSYAGRTIHLKPTSVDAHFYRGMASFQMGELDTASKSLKQVLSLQQGHYQAAFTLGKIYNQLASPQEALVFFDTALRSAKSNDQKAQISYQLGLTKKRSLDFKNALENFEKVVALASSPDLKKMALVEAMAIYQEKKAVAKVIECMKSILRIDPSDQEIKKKIGYYMELNRNSYLQEFEMAGVSQFSQLCKRLCGVITKVDTIQDIEINQDGSVDIMASRTSKTEHSVYLFRYIRSKGDIGEMIVRELYAKMRSSKGEKAYMVANSGYTEGAVAFAQTRVITLIDKSALLQYLDKIKD